MFTLYGISSCSTVSKARRFLEAHDLEYQFHDFKKQSISETLLSELEARIGLDVMLNKRSTTWRQLDESQKKDMNLQKAIALMIEKPTLIKRPLLDTGEQLLVGFNEAEYKTVL